MLAQLTQPVRLGMQTLKLHKLRSLLTILGVVFGVGSVIIMLAIGEGARRQAIEAISQLGASNIILRSTKPADASGAAWGAIRYGITNADLRVLKQTVNQIKVLAPLRDHRRQFHHHEYIVTGRIVGVTPTYASLNDVRLSRGRFIEDLDCDNLSAVAVLGSGVAGALFPLEDPIGREIRVGKDQYYRVIGVLRPRAKSPGVGSGMPAQDYGRDVYIPFATDQKRFGENVVFDRASSQPPEKVEITQVTIALNSTDDVKSTARIVQSLMAHKNDEVAMTVPLDLLEQAEETQRVFTWVLTAIASISLLVGGIGIMNIMLATVTERTCEIGIRRALGARRADIVWQFLVETTVLSSAGGLIGVALGLGGAYAATSMTGIPTIVRFWSPLLAFGVSIAVGMIFGIYPARRAAHMDPIQALRHE